MTDFLDALVIEHFQNSKYGKFYLAGSRDTYISYQLQKGGLRIVHTEVAPRFRGKGIGRRMVEQVLLFAHEQNLTISSSCSYAAHIIDAQISEAESK